MTSRYHENEDERNSAVAEVSRRYAARYATIEQADLSQECHRVLGENDHRFDPTRGSYAVFSRVILYRTLARYIWRVLSPVTASQPEKHRILAAELPEDLSAQASGGLWRLQVRARVRELLSDERGTSEILEVLLGDETPACVAERLGVDVGLVYNATQRARRRIARDERLRAFWEAHQCQDQNPEIGSFEDSTS